MAGSIGCSWCSPWVLESRELLQPEKQLPLVPTTHWSPGRGLQAC